MKKSRNLFESFGYAISGVIYTLKTQRNMRIHFFIAVLITATSKYLELETFELLAVLFAISLVMITEMINTAVESVVDMFTEKYHPLAETAKNVAAGAVLIAAINALVVGYIVFINSGKLLTFF
jgi:diacylglycerol kinase (ATP)